MCCDGLRRASIDQRVEYAARSIGEHLEVIDQHMQRVGERSSIAAAALLLFLWVIACGQRRYRVG